MCSWIYITQARSWGGSGGSDEPPPHSRKGPQNVLCIVHVGNDDLAQSGVYLRNVYEGSLVEPRLLPVQR